MSAKGGASGHTREVVWSHWMRGKLSFWLVDYKTGRSLMNHDGNDREQGRA